MDAFYRNAIALGSKYHGNIWNILVRSLASKASKQKSTKNIVDPNSGKGQTQELLEALAPRTDRVELSEEELADAAARAKEYSRMKMREHRAWQANFMEKVKLRKAAINALPEEIQEAARKPDLSLFPTNRYAWVETPPFDEDEMKQEKVSDGQKKKRPIGTKVL